MPNLSELFFTVLERENDTIQNTELNNKLTEIYGDAPRTYEQLEEDFDICKTQLLALLEYIEQLNPNALQLFAVYKERVSELNKNSALPDIRITLKAAKEALEKSLLAIISKHTQIDTIALNNLTTGLCYAGAYVNVEQALGYFNGTSSLSAMIHYAKKNIILDLAAAFLNEHGMVEYEGNEVHYANALFNYVADKYGLLSQEDLFAPTYEVDTLEAFDAYVSHHMTIPALIQHVMRLLPPLQETITQMPEFQHLTDLFQILGHEKPGLKEYMMLYDDEDIDDIATYVRKPNWDLLLTGVLASSMQKAGYITDVHAIIDCKSIVDTGEYIFDASNDTVTVLSQEDLLLLVDSSDTSIEKWRLIRQMTPESILKAYLKEGQFEEIKSFLFGTLLGYAELPEVILSQLYLAVRNSGRVDQLRELSHYIFATRQQIPFDELTYLVGLLSPEEIYHYLVLAMNHDIPYQVKALLTCAPSPLSPMHVIHLACQNNALNVIRLLGQLGFDLNIMDNVGYTPACIAVASQNRELLIALHAGGADLQRAIPQSHNGITHQGKSPVQIAAALGYSSMIETLHELGVDLNRADRNGDTAACIAINNNDTAMLEKLHELGVDLNKKSGSTGLFFSMFASGPSLSPLELAVRTGNIDMIRVLKILDVNLDVLDGADDTPIGLAIHMNKLPVISVLHELGADISQRDKNGLSPTDHAARNGNSAALKLLKELGADINEAGPSGATPSFVAAEQGRADSIRTLKTLKADFNQANNAQQTPVFIAAKNGHIKVINWLHRYGADINKTDNQGHTPVYIAALHGRLQAFNELVNYGADLNEVCQNISDLIYLNSKSNDKKMFFRLLETDINLESITDSTWLQILNNLDGNQIEVVLNILIKNDNVSVFKKLLNIPLISNHGILHYQAHFAAEHAQSESILQLIHQSGINMDSSNGYGESLAYVAAKAGNALVLRQLIALNVDLDSVTEDVETPAFVAARMGHESIIQLLLEQGKANTPVTITVSTLKDLVKKMDAQIVARAEEKIQEQEDWQITLTPRDIAHIMGHEHIVTLIDSYQPAPQTPQNRFSFFAQPEVASPSSRNRSISEDENSSPTASPSKANPKKRASTGEILSPIENKKPYQPSDPDAEYQHRP
ncbi:ankyrin repeat domain-containing protein [Legionella shakespearei]|uniref:Ankyrin repeat protein n=1 Tax=Legionella shakespearei DSM 23087 TaxID=1122169 RepID=A0A0W0YUH0_9GAMM|nr:ankyrin repeat domain-containing protein [Legionella shakespearei]KTD60528.1 Ankyrin repeat protein [Legionella shakespearei DSM 23087]